MFCDDNQYERRNWLPEGKIGSHTWKGDDDCRCIPFLHKRLQLYCSLINRILLVIAFSQPHSNWLSDSESEGFCGSCKPRWRFRTSCSPFMITLRCNLIPYLRTMNGRAANPSKVFSKSLTSPMSVAEWWHPHSATTRQWPKKLVFLLRFDAAS